MSVLVLRVQTGDHGGGDHDRGRELPRALFYVPDVQAADRRARLREDKPGDLLHGEAVSQCSAGAYVVSARHAITREWLEVGDMRKRSDTEQPERRKSGI